jgi:Uncharacterized protein conserved in bacteria (DUF2059)
MIRRTVVLAALGAVLSSSAAPATGATLPRHDQPHAVARPDRASAADLRTIDQLLDLSGLGPQLESMTTGVRVQFLRGRTGLSGQDRMTVDRIVAERFDAAVLHSRIRMEFERNLDRAKLARALAWYDSPLGKRITGLELAALISMGGPDALAELENARPSARRLLLVERLDTGGGASETTVDVTMAIVRSLTRAFQPALPAVARLTPNQLDDQLARARNRTLEKIRDVSLVNMLVSYRSLSDHELEQYVDFVESEAGQWYMGLMNGALLAAIDTAAESTAAELVTAVPQIVGDLR